MSGDAPNCPEVSDGKSDFSRKTAFLVSWQRVSTPKRTRRHDLTSYFQGTTGQLFVRSKRGDEVFPLSNILGAEVVEESDEGTAVYGLCLVLRDSSRRLQCTDFLTQGRGSKAELADQINQFLSRNTG
jgi:hypothetical protein